MMKKIVALMLVILLGITFLVGCDKKIYITTGLKDNEIFKISGEKCGLGEILLVLMTEKSRYEEELGDDIWQSAAQTAQMTLEDEIKQKVKNQLIELKLIEGFADNQQITIAEEVRNSIKQAATEYMLTLTEEQKKLIGITVEDVENLYTSFYKSEKVYDKLTANIDIEISDEEARVIEVNYIFIATCKLDENNNKIPYTQDELVNVNTKVEEVKELLDKGNDFLNLATQYSDSKNVTRSFARGEMVEAFEKAAFELEVGETSQVVTTNDGYYFIYCVSDYLKDETELKKVEKEDNIRKAAYYETYNPYKAQQTLEYNDKVWNTIKLSNYKDIDTKELYSIYNKYMNP